MNRSMSRFVYMRILLDPIIIGLLFCAIIPVQAGPPTEPVLRHSEVVFMYAADDDAYRAYDADKLDGKQASAFIQTVDGVQPNATGDVNLSAGTGISITPDVAGHKVTISATSNGGDNLGNNTATQNIK